jgi:hypothetical protein
MKPIITRSQAFEHLAHLELIVNEKLHPNEMVMPNGKLFPQCSQNYIGKIAMALQAYGIELPNPGEKSKVRLEDMELIITREEAIKHQANLEAVADGKLSPHDLRMPNGKRMHQCSRKYIDRICMALSAYGIAPLSPAQVTKFGNNSGYREFQCYGCGKKFWSPRTDEEADTEFEQIFGSKGYSREKEGVVTCDDCHNKLMARMAAPKH